MPKQKNKATKPFNKNIGPFLAFSPEWFKQYQKILLWFLNTRGVRIWARWILRIHKDIPIKMAIAEIGPHFFIFDRHLVKIENRWRIQQTADFRTHPKFAKRIYFAFKPAWWLVHYWDQFFADIYAPKFSYGFSTLTAFPVAGNNSPIDGKVAREFGLGSGESFSTLRTSTGNSTDTLSDIINCIQITSDNVSNQFIVLRRFILCFDTSSITSPATISAAEYDFVGNAKSNVLGDINIHVTGATPAATNALATGDYAQLGTTSFGSLAYASINTDTSTYNVIALDANGIANIDKAGISKFGMKNHFDQTNTAPTWGSVQTSGFTFSSADTTGTSVDPKLVVTYSTSTAWTKTLTETVTLTDTVLKTATRILTQTISLTDVLTALRVFTKNMTETVTLTDVLTKFNSRTLTETLTLTNVLIKIATRTLTETLSILDVFAYIVTKFIGTVFMRSKGQNYPRGMDQNDPSDMRSNQQSSPKGMDDSSIK